jgi:hypothetical protein
MKFYIFLLFTALCVSLVYADQLYTVLNISDIAQDSEIVPLTGTCINNSCDVSGHGMPTAEGSRAKPFMYVHEKNALINLGNLNGNFTDGYGGNGYAINNAGYITGRNSMVDYAFDYGSFLYADLNGNAAVNAGEMIVIDSEDTAVGGVGINENNQIIGISSDPVFGGWLWTDSNENMAADAGEKVYFQEFFPNGINDNGDMAMVNGSESWIWVDADQSGTYEESEKQMMPVPVEGYFDETVQMQITIDEISARYINNSGGVCGAAKNFLGKTNVFYWEDANENGIVEKNEYYLFGTALTTTHVRNMNNHGHLVGSSYIWPTPQFSQSQRNAFIWTKEDGPLNINDLVSYEHPVYGPVWFTQAEGINDYGQIVCNGWFDTDGDGRKGTNDAEHVFIISPVVQGDITDDIKVDNLDVSVFAAEFGRNDCSEVNNYCNGADFDKNASVNIADLIILSENWLNIR